LRPYASGARLPWRQRCAACSRRTPEASCALSRPATHIYTYACGVNGERGWRRYGGCQFRVSGLGFRVQGLGLPARRGWRRTRESCRPLGSIRSSRENLFAPALRRILRGAGEEPGVSFRPRQSCMRGVCAARARCACARRKAATRRVSSFAHPIWNHPSRALQFPVDAGL
jgi:hypothetical protein